MNVWSISDLHLSFARPDRRERYAERWRDHANKLEREWRAVVRADDLVLLPGDVSMARNHRDLQPDLDWLHSLPGTKVLSAGNHDHWWNGVENVQRILRKSILAVGGNAVKVNNIIVCGAMGTAVLAEEPEAQQREVEDRELAALDASLAEGATLRVGSEPLIVLWHYPPFDAHRRPGPCVSRFQASRVSICLYGHLHIQAQWSLATQGMVQGTRYYCVAADALGFRPLRIPLSVR
ncbi:metallophosphoesterase [Singulisphaera sp. PoT]|uniref:metallophosphoesterase n=1 Tax=Singulisphaera sp. PoT TaxID=3411797 RepID=UPI003BF57CEE